MALLGDRVQETTTSTGTGSITLNGAVTGYVTFNSTFSNGNSVWYVIDDGAGNWEIGYGTVGTGTLTRTVFQSSNANALVPFGVGTKRVFCTAPYTYLLPDQTGNSGKILTTDGTTSSWTTIASAGGVTSVSVASANGFAGTSSGGSTPALTLSTSISGILKGNGTAISAAVAGTDYAAANASFTLGSTSVSLGGTTTTVAGLTLTNPTINGFTGDTSVVNIGSGQFYKDTSGNVGIGTSSPATKLHVSGTGSTPTLFERTGSNGVYLQLKDASGSSVYLGASNGVFAIQTPGSSYSDKLVIDSSGNVGIGTSSPANKLHVSGDGSASLFKVQATNTNGTASINLVPNGTGNGQIYTETGALLFSPASTERMRLDSSGNLGIGTSSPSYKLDIAGDIKVRSGDAFFFGDTSVYTARTSNGLYWGTGSLPRMYLDSSGNLGLGVTPSAWTSGFSAFQAGNVTSLYNDNNNNTIIARNAYRDSVSNKYIISSAAQRILFNNDGSFVFGQAPSGTAGAAISFTQAMTLTSGGNLLVGTTTDAGRITANGNIRTLGGNIELDTGQVTTNSSSNPLVLGVNGVERARIDSSGNLLVGMTSPGFSQNGFNANLNQGANIWGVGVGGNSVSSSLTGYSLYSTSGSAYKFYVQYSGSIFATSTTITAISDQRLKENIRDLDDGLATILALKPRKFDWKEGKGKDIKDDRGFIAQEFEQVFPDMIDTWKDPAPEGEEPYKSVRPDLIPVLVKAIQELSAELNELKAKVNA